MKKIHTLEEKIRAVKKASKPGVLTGDVAKEIGIHTFSLYRWKKELRDIGLKGKMNNKGEIKNNLDIQKELKRLEKENKQLKMENAVLKKLKGLDDAQKKKSFK